LIGAWGKQLLLRLRTCRLKPFLFVLYRLNSLANLRNLIFTILVDEMYSYTYESKEKKGSGCYNKPITLAVVSLLSRLFIYRNWHGLFLVPCGG
jgi:hypothetical protein